MVPKADASDCLDLVRSVFPGAVWPAVPDAVGATALALQYQLYRSQWQSADAILGQQLRQLESVLRHAYETVPCYRQRLGAAGYRPGMVVTTEWLRGLPLLTRAEVQAQGVALHSRTVPQAHAPVGSGQTSGSTGRPITFLTTAVTELFWRVLNLRDHLWHRRDFSLKLAGIRPDRIPRGEEGQTLPSWGPSVGEAFRDGSAVLLHSANTIDLQIAWLSRVAPGYLVTLGTNLLELAREMKRRGHRVPGLKEACTYGDTVTPAQRAECRALLGVPVTDIYSAQEAGYIALQCPEHDCYHVQSESVIVELLDDAGLPSTPGTVGRVVLTTLHNFAMPLIRYEIGDYAEAGEPCPCGRGLPVIRRVLGRERNMAEAPDGSKFYPTFAAEVWMDIAPIRQLQLVQRSRLRIEARVVAERPLAAAEREALAAALRRALGHDYEIPVVRVDGIARSPSGKYEDFLRET